MGADEIVYGTWALVPPRTRFQAPGKRAREKDRSVCRGKHSAAIGTRLVTTKPTIDPIMKRTPCGDTPSYFFSFLVRGRPGRPKDTEWPRAAAAGRAGPPMGFGGDEGGP